MEGCLARSSRCRRAPWHRLPLPYRRCHVLPLFYAFLAVPVGGPPIAGAPLRFFAVWSIVPPLEKLLGDGTCAHISGSTGCPCPKRPARASCSPVVRYPLALPPFEGLVGLRFQASCPQAVLCNALQRRSMRLRAVAADSGTEQRLAAGGYQSVGAGHPVRRG
jgi:hypothetical protein